MESKRPGNSSDGAPPAKMAKQEVFVGRRDTDTMVFMRDLAYDKENFLADFDDGRVAMAVHCKKPLGVIKIAVLVFKPGSHDLISDRGLRIDQDLSERAMVLFGDRLIAAMVPPTYSMPVHIAAIAGSPPFLLATREYNRFCFEKHLRACPKMTLGAFFGQPTEMKPTTRMVDGKSNIVMYHGSKNTEPFACANYGSFMTPSLRDAQGYLFPHLECNSEGILYEFELPEDSPIIDISAIFGELCNTYGLNGSAYNARELVAGLKELGLLRVVDDVFLLHVYYQGFNEFIALKEVDVAAANKVVKGQPGSTPMVLDRAAIKAEESNQLDLFCELYVRFK